MVICWSAASFSYYLITFNVKYMDGSIYIVYLIAYGSEVLGNFTGAIFIKIYKTWKVLCISFAFAGIFALVFAIFSYVGDWVTYASVLIIKFGIGSAFNGLYIANYELFPNIFLATCFAICHFTSNFATVASPLIAELDNPIPMIALAVITLIASKSLLFLRKPVDTKISDEELSKLLTSTSD